MKGYLLLITSVLFATTAFGQSRKMSPAQVDKVLNVPVYMYSYPDQDYEEIETLNATWSAVAVGLDGMVQISEQTNELIRKAKRKRDNGKVPDFNAILVNPDDFSGILVLLSDESSLNAEVNRVEGVPVYLYSYPTNEYVEIKQVSAPWSALSEPNQLRERVSELILHARRKERKGKIDPFDAIIISPDDFTGILIKFKD